MACAATASADGRAADLDPSTRTAFKEIGEWETPGVDAHNRQGSHGGSIPFSASFLIFSDDMRPPRRLAELMVLHVAFVFTYDRIAVGEDGPVHQTIDQWAWLRAMPHLSVIRPVDANEIAVAWRVALEATGQPVLLVLTRQRLPTLDRTTLASADGCGKGPTCSWMHQTTSPTES